MKANDIWAYIYVGTCLRYLQDSQTEDKVHGKGKTIDNIDLFLSSLDALGLNVTKRAAEKLALLRSRLVTKPKDETLTLREARQLQRTSTELRDTFMAETKGIFVYIVTDKRLDLRKLLDGVSGLFAPNVFDICPEVAQYDFQEAGKCIAFERPTAAAFHMLRATEAVLRLYYRRYIRPARSGLAWGQMTSPLRAKTTGRRPDPIILDNLDHIRRSFRNPTQHPDKIYDIEEAQDLFGLCVDLVNRMAKAIKS